MHYLLEAKTFPDVGAAGCRPPALMDPELQETSRPCNLGPGPHPAAHSLRASVSSDVTGNPYCLAHLGWEEYTGPEMVRDLGMMHQGPPAPIFPRKPKPRGAGEVGPAGTLGPQDSLAGAYGALQRPQGPVWVGSERQEELEGPERMDFQTQWLRLHLELPHLSPLILAMAGAQVRGCHLFTAQI